MNRSVLAYLTSYGISFLGNSVAVVVLPLVVLQTTGSALDAGLVAAATALPAFVAGLFMGSVVDRYDRRWVSVLTDVISGAAVAALPITALFTDLGLGWFVLFGILGSFGDVPGLTAREALLLPVARRSSWTVDRLVGLREGTAAITMIVGPAIAAGLVTALDGTEALWVTAGMSLLAALITLVLPGDVGVIGASPAGSSPRAVLAHLAEGWSLLFLCSPFLLTVTVLTLVLASCLAAVQGLLLPVHFTITGDEGRLGLVLSSLAVGMLVGAGVYAAVGTRLSRRVWLVVGLLGSAAGLLVIGSLPAVWLVFGGAAIVGTFGGMVSTVLGVLMTERIPEQLRGRVTGTQNALLTVAPSLGILATAVLVDQVSLEAAGLAIGGLWAVVAVAALFLPSLRDLSSSESSQSPELVA
ncbi:Sugar transporter [Nocardioides exalbidus]|uniref:Sugar transporter n=1 Tax=Nocardioides exalbidus TaxID=402596 RepID=A0A1H4KP30_9ACTN|nr:MFS transporter [Nocardioides exalbidus]SEB60294.1 Sugar transporter [Nocardioides exalbidus]